MQQTSASQFMPQPPEVITTKDHLYLTDMMNWNLTAAKKCHDFALRCQDVELSQLLDQTSQMHKKHYELILNELNKSVQQPAMAGGMQ
ncbi:hypothetical protein G4V62_15860 [Bacillaceae bacterium SIJ1]|nr:hypothetical protein [Litoribacterium kuwaitense]